MPSNADRSVALICTTLAAVAAAAGPSPTVAATAAPWTTQFGRMVEMAPAIPAVPMAAIPLPSDAQAIACLAEAIDYEAGNEPREGQAAVAEVILNRVAHPAFPKSVCGVVFQGSHRRTGCQFTFTCDGSRLKPRSARSREAARQVAAAALAGARLSTLAGATHYHANYVSPYWAPSLVRVAAIGAHIFYRFPGRIAPAAPATPATLPEPAQFAPWGLKLKLDPDAL